MAPDFTPLDPDFVSKVTHSFDRQKIMKTLKATIDTIDAGKVTLEFPYNEQFTQQHGFIHAGIISTILDSACGYAAFSLMPKGAAVLSVEFKVNLLSPAKGEIFRAKAKVKKAGRTISVVDSELFSCHKNQKKLIATMTATIMTVMGREDINN